MDVFGFNKFNDNLSIICAAICVLIAACQGSDRITVDRGVKAAHMLSSSLSCSDNLMSEEDCYFTATIVTVTPLLYGGEREGAGRTHLFMPSISCSIKRNRRSWGPLCVSRSAEDDI